MKARVVNCIVSFVVVLWFVIGFLIGCLASGNDLGEENCFDEASEVYEHFRTSEVQWRTEQTTEELAHGGGGAPSYT